VVDHPAGDLATHQERAGEVHPQYLLPVGEIKFQEQYAMLDSRIVDHDANRAHLVLDPGHRLSHLQFVRHVEGSRVHPICPVPVPKALLGILQGSLVHAVEHNRGPRICKPGRERTADTATRTGYQSDPVGEIESIHPASLPELRAQSRGRAPTSSSLAEEERLRSLLLSTAARDFPDARSSPLRLLVFLCTADLTF
jgi:hypothetical protein